VRGAAGRRSLREDLERWGAGAVLFLDMANIRYLTGFSGSDGALVVSGTADLLLVDGRYTTQARGQADGLEVREYRDKVEGIASALSEGGWGSVAFESWGMTFEFYEKLRGRLPGLDLRPLGDDLRRLRAVKDDEEIACLKEAARISREALLQTLPLLRPGTEERVLAAELEYRLRLLGAEDVSFPTIVASGPNAALPHARPGERRIGEGDAVIVDYGAVVKGYRADETRTFFVGDAGRELKDVYEVVREAQETGIAAVKAGVSCRYVDDVVREYIVSRGWGSYFTHGTGHGVGLEVHEYPRLGPLSEAVLEEGMVVTVEPGVYLPGRGGVRIEDMVLVEKDGARILTRSPKG